MRRPLPWLALALGTYATGAPLFQIETSTREVLCLARFEDRVLAGTRGGLLVLDLQGRRLHHELPGTPVHALVGTPSGEGELLAATDAGLLRYRGEEGTLTSRVATTALARTSEGWATGHRRGVVRWERSEGKPWIVRLPTASPLLHLLPWQQGLLAGNRDGLWSIDRQGAVHEVELGEAGERPGTTWLAPAPDGVYVGTTTGLWILRRDHHQRVATPVHVRGGALLRGEVLVGTHAQGVLALRENRWVPVARELDAATDLVELAPGQLLVASEGSGIQRLRRALHRIRGGGLSRFEAPASEPPARAITALTWVPQRGELWAATLHDGLGVRDSEGWRRPPGSGLPSAWVNELASDGPRVLARTSEGDVVATQDGGATWAPLGVGVGWPKTWTSSLGRDVQGPWVGTLSAYYLLAPSGRWEVLRPRPTLEGRQVTALLRAGSQIFAGTHRAGLFENGPGGWQHASIQEGLEDSWVRALATFRGRVWVATAHGGLAHRSLQGGPWEVLRSQDEVLPSDEVHGLLATQDLLLVATGRGLVCGDGSRWGTFQVDEGLPADHVTALAASDSRLFVGTRAGLAIADLSAIRRASRSRPARRRP